MTRIQKAGPQCLAAGVLVAAAAVAPSLAWADALPIAPTTATFKFKDTRIQPVALGAATVKQGVVSSPVESITVVKQGPGPIHVELPDTAGLQLTFGAYSASFTDIAFDLKAKTLSADVAFNYPAPCAKGKVCAAVMKTAVFSDLPILLATNIKGNIDGGMPLDKALAVPTFAPMKVNMTADMVLNFKALAPVAKQLGLNFPQSAAFPGVIGTFTLAPTVAVPETSTYAMMGLGMAGLLVVRRRRPA